MAGGSSARDGEGDDFTRISGIGKVFERRLREAGVKSYADLAVLSPEEISSLLAEVIAVRPERIRDEDWTGQAARLAEGAAEARTAAAAEDTGEAGEAGDVGTPAPPVVSTSSPEPQTGNGTGLYYQSFVVRILLRESDGRITSTTVQHVGSGTERRWPGLDQPALLEFISAYLSSGAPAPTPPGAQAVPPVEGPVIAPAHAEAAEDMAAGNSAPSLPGSSPMHGEVSLTLGKDPRVPRSGEPFTVSITLDLTGVEPPAESRVGFSAVVLARPLSGAAPQVVSQGKGIIPADAPLITLHSPGLPAGTYRLEGVVELIETQGRSRNLAASMEGSIMVVSGAGAEPSPSRQLQPVQ
jgi:hypothetical protein